MVNINPILDKFKKCCADYEEKSATEFRAYPAGDKYVYFQLIQTNDCYHLNFWVDSYAQNRVELQKKLKSDYDKNYADVKRYFRWGTYYNSSGLFDYNPILDDKDLETDLTNLQKAIEPVLKICASNQASNGNPQDCAVGICSETVEKILTWPLSIPNYQRGYCWNRGNVIGLLRDVEKWLKNRREESDMYHIGTIVLKQTEKAYDVIDGQQRLITLGLYALVKEENIYQQLKQFRLGENNSTKEAQYYLLSARETIRNWTGKIDLKRLRMSVIVIGKDQSEDLAFLFFSHLNSSGKRLSDYDLLKSHHLRFVSDDVAEVLARHWGELDNPANPYEIRQLLHLVLYRLRQWLMQKTDFPCQADETENHALFHHYTLGFERIEGLCTSYKATQLNSMLSSGLEFFNYVDFYHQLMKQFVILGCVQLLAPLQWHSNGTLYWGILALSFMFYCKYGELYLPDAIYAIAWQVSRLRNETQIRRDYISRQSLFASLAAWIDQSTHESEFLGKVLSPANDYLVRSCKDRPTATAYWETLKTILEELPANVIKQHSLARTIEIK